MKVHVKNSTIIRPAQETPEQRLRCSDLDLTAPAVHFPLVNFYRRPIDSSSNFFEAGLLKKALSDVLVLFYPMAGRLGRDENGRIEIHCNGKGALFIEAETSCVMDDLDGFDSSSMLPELVPMVDSTKNISSYPLLLTQVTHFRCGGVCLGFSMHHTLSDATSIFQFINAWAETTLGGVPISIQPFIDPQLMLKVVELSNSPKFHHMEYDSAPSMNNNNVSTTQNPESQSNPKPLSSSVLHLSLDQINTLRSKSIEDHNKPSIKFTKFEIIAAHIWRCMCKARGLSGDQSSKLHMPVNGRLRLNPPLPSGYIGNVLFTASSIASSGDLQSEPLNVTVERVQKALKRMDDEYLKSALAYLNQLPDPRVLKRGPQTYKCPNLSISNLFHMPVYDADFGWGKPIFVRTLPIVDGVTHVFPSSRDDGSLYLVINIETQHFQHFKKLFYDIF